MNVVEDDDSISFVYTHATNSYVTLEVVYHEGDYQVSNKYVEFIAICSPNWVQIWKGRDWKTVF